MSNILCFKQLAEKLQLQMVGDDFSSINVKLNWVVVSNSKH